MCLYLPSSSHVGMRNWLSAILGSGKSMPVKSGWGHGWGGAPTMLVTWQNISYVKGGDPPLASMILTLTSTEKYSFTITGTPQQRNITCLIHRNGTNKTHQVFHLICGLLKIPKGSLVSWWIIWCIMKPMNLTWSVCPNSNKLLGW